jgi:acetolactate synthase I/II/III large subunit
MKFEKKNGSSELIAALKKNKIKDIFVYPGGTIAPILDLLEQEKIKIFCSRHEQGAGYAALAASKVKKKTQVSMVSSGPGVTNVITPVADAYFDSIPMIIITGQVGQKDMKKSTGLRQKGFQEVDTVNLFKSVVKASFQPKRPEEVYKIIDQAFEISISGRPGPVLIDMPMDVQRGFLKSKRVLNKKKKIKILKILNKKNKIKKIYNLFKKSKKPLILCGQGVVLSKMERMIRKISSTHQIPVTMSLLALGAIPSDNKLSLGFHGHTGNQAAGIAIQECDLLIVIGSRLDLRQVGTQNKIFAKNAKIIRIDIDINEIKNSRISCDLNLIGPIQYWLPIFYRTISKIQNDYKDWINKIYNLKKIHQLTYKKSIKLKPQKIIEEFDILTKYKKKLICVTGVGQHQQWTGRHFSFDNPKRTWFTSGGHGTMGYDLPVSIGAQYSSRKSLVLCFVGDGSFQMNIQELASLYTYNLPVKIIILDNQRLGIVSQFQKLNFKKDPTCGQKWNPDFCKLARSYGLFAIKVTNSSDLKVKIRKILNYKGPAILHCMTDPNEELSPMLLAGQELDKMWKK